MKLVLLASGRLKERYAKLGCELFASRIKRLVPFEVVEVPEPKGARQTVRGGRVTKKLLSRLKDGDRLVLLDSSGKELSSEELAVLLERELAASKRLVFMIGGPYGLGPEAHERADDALSLGRITLPHELARLVLLEQLYRALAIRKGLPYHHGE